MNSKKIGILYICTGRYKVFWKNFYKSCEQYFLSGDDYAGDDYVKHYYVFTDAGQIAFENTERVSKIYQESMPWPYPTLYRYKIFQKIQLELRKMDYLYFFNANALFVRPVNEEMLPTRIEPLVVVKHPMFFDKPCASFTYETNPQSLACIDQTEGSHYFMGGLNGGKTNDYLSLINELKRRVEVDEQNGIIALWHDESHLNRYAIDHQDKLKMMPPSYVYPDEKNPPFETCIVLRDKNRYGGNGFMRKEKHFQIHKGMLKVLKPMIYRIKQIWQSNSSLFNF